MCKEKAPELAKAASQVTPTVVALRTMATDVVDAEVARIEARLPDLTVDELASVRHALRRVADKLIHTPTVRVQQLVDGDVLHRGPAPQDGVRRRHQRDPCAVQVGVEVAGRQVHGLVGGQVEHVEQEWGETARVGGMASGELHHPVVRVGPVARRPGPLRTGPTSPSGWNTASCGRTQDVFGDLATVSFGFSQGWDEVRKTGDNAFDETVDRRNYRFGLQLIVTPRLMTGLNYEAITDEGFLNHPYRSVRYLDETSARGVSFQPEL